MWLQKSNSLPNSLLSIAIKFSRLNFGLLVIAHVLAAVALLYPLAIPLWLHTGLWLGVFASAGYHFIWCNTRRYRVIKLISHANGNWCVVFAARSLTELVLHYRQVYLSSLVIILPFKSVDETYTLVLWRDSVDADDWRMLHSILSQQILALASAPDSTVSRFSSKL